LDKAEAEIVLREHLERFRKLSYSELLRMIDGEEIIESVAPSGLLYQIEIQIFWDEKAKGTIRVAGAIDDGGVSAFRPLCEDFIIRPDGSFAGE
jgi:hypothetical protein